MPITTKKYKCKRCGHITEQATNHYGETWSCGHSNCCPNCPPWAKYPEFGGVTFWECMEKEPQTVASEQVMAISSVPFGFGFISLN